MSAELPTTHKDRFLSVVGGEPLVTHCHHYNTALQQVIQDAAASLPTDDLLRDPAAVVAHHQMSEAFEGMGLAERRTFAAEYFRRAGYGRLDFASANADGGTIRLDQSHYGLGFRARKALGEQPTPPTCHFAAGYAAGALAAIFDLPAGAFLARETACLAGGADHCTLELTRATPPRDLPASVGAGVVPEALPPRPAPPRPTGVDEATILAALARLPMTGNEEGVLPAFGVYLTRHYASYYNDISYEFERRLAAQSKSLGDAAAEVLMEAGYQCAFYTLGGMMESPEWDAVVGPMLGNRADWVFGIVAAVNARGWGRWTVTELVEGERLTVRIDAGYESNGYLARYGVGDRPRCHLSTGVAAGIMNHLFVGDVTTRPTLDLEYYQRLYSGADTFRGHEHRCRSKGDAYCEIVATRADG